MQGVIIKIFPSIDKYCIIDALFSRIRVFRFRLRFYYYKVKIKYPKHKFLWDNSDKFKILLKKLINKSYKKVLIIGSSPNVNILTKEKFDEYTKDKDTLILGLNRSYIKYKPDIVLWADVPVMKGLLDEKDINRDITFLFVSQLLDERRYSLKLWKEHKSFDNYPYKTLFKARTILVSALYLIYVLDIKNIELYGISLDDGKYFYNNSKERNSLEFLTKERIDKQYYGYTMQKITKEVLEYLIQNDFKVKYGGESHFLDSIDGIIKC